MSQQIPAKQFVALVKSKVSSKQRASDAMSHISAKLKAAKKDANLNKKAFDVVFAAYKMDEDDRNEFFDCISLYQDMMDEANAWADGQHTGDLVKMAESDSAADEMKDDKPDEAAAEQAVVNENVVKLRRGIKKLEEDHTATVAAAKAEPADDIDNIPAVLERRPGRKKAVAEPAVDASAVLNEMTDSATAVH